MRRTLRQPFPCCVGVALLACLSCAPPAEIRLEQLERETTRIQDELAEARAQLVAKPSAGWPAWDQRGEPLPVPPDVKTGDLVGDFDPDCPELISTYLRAETGSTCADYEAEISVFVRRCVASCDTAGLARRTVRVAMNVCSQFCTEKRCGTATFIPPSTGCGAGNCYSPAEDCKSRDCPLNEYCSLIHIDRVWNCFCRDILPT